MYGPAVAFPKASTAPSQEPIYAAPSAYHAPRPQWGTSPHIHSRLPPVPIPIHSASQPHAHPPAQPRLKPIPLPPQIAGVTSIALHPALAHSGGTALAVDLAGVTSLPTASNAAWQRQWQHLSLAPATHPPLPSLTILSPCLPWAITAHASGKTLRSGGVSVADVLNAIWEALGRQVDREGFRDWEIIMQMTQRERQGGSGRHRPSWRNEDRVTYRDGMARIELLGGRTVFEGLSASDMGCDTWVLESA